MRIIGYLIFTGGVLAVIVALNLPSIILVGYLLIAGVGFFLLLGDIAKRASIEKMFRESVPRLIAEAEMGARAAEAAKRSPWFADSVVDLDAARQRAVADGHWTLRYSFLDVPDPFFVLPREALVKWGFAIEAEVGVAYQMAGDGTAPARWGYGFMRDLGYMGWDRTESVARIGLFLLDLDGRRPAAST